MNKEYLNIYNNLIKLTRNKLLYEKMGYKDTFSERLTILLFHFAFFLKNFKSIDLKNKIQEIYDFMFKQVELSVREIGYGDVTINKKMKDYINLFHSIIRDIDKWENLKIEDKYSFFLKYLNKDADIEFFANYFAKYRLFLKKNTLKSFSKDIINPEI